MYLKWLIPILLLTTSYCFSENFIYTREQDQHPICATYSVDYLLYTRLFPVKSRKSKKRFELITPLKAGTHLLVKTLSLLSGNLGSGALGTYRIWGIQPDYLNLETFNKYYFSIQHFYAPEDLDYQLNSESNTVTMIRDPRDILVSQSFGFEIKDEQWVKSSTKERIKILLNNPNILHNASDIKPQLDMLFHLISSKENVFMVRFENLVGSKGGGSDLLQRKEISNLANFLGIEINNLQLNFLQGNLFGGKWGTFRNGCIGCWKEYFDEDLKQLFKEKYGSYLVKFGYEADDQW